MPAPAPATRNVAGAGYSEPMAVLSKSRLIAFRQCPRRLWLELHRPELRQDSSATQAAFATGHEVGQVARRLYDPLSAGATLDLAAMGVPGAIAATRELIVRRKPIFEAGFQIVRGQRGARAFADVLLPLRTGGGWRMVEVKSTTKLKDYQRDDAAIQYHIASSAGLAVRKVQVACIDSNWTYAGGGDYRGLLKEHDVTADAVERTREVQGWLRQAHQIAESKAPLDVPTGAHCERPFSCGFAAHCSREEERALGKVKHPVQWLPGRRSNALQAVIDQGARSLRDVPDDLLSAVQARVKTHTLHKTPYFDAAGAAAGLADHTLPALFLDFETISFAVPRWAGTRPYEQVPFQFSLHRLEPGGLMRHEGFLDLSGDDPRERIARALVKACGRNEPVLAYHASFEGSRLTELGRRFPSIARRLESIRARLVDLEPIARQHFYHPQQEGSWSIKSVLPAIAPDLSYAQLEGVQDGGGAQAAYLEASNPVTAAVRREQLREQLWRYCRLDTFAMVRLWSHFAGRLQASTRVDRCASAEARP